jgi:hypothetical protein
LPPRLRMLDPRQSRCIGRTLSTCGPWCGPWVAPSRRSVPRCSCLDIVVWSLLNTPDAGWIRKLATKTVHVGSKAIKVYLENAEHLLPLAWAAGGALTKVSAQTLLPRRRGLEFDQHPGRRKDLEACHQDCARWIGNQGVSGERPAPAVLGVGRGWHPHEGWCSQGQRRWAWLAWRAALRP